MKNWKKCFEGFALGAFPWAIFLSCTPEQLAHVSNAADKRETICAFAQSWESDLPELKRVQEMCAAGEDLKVIAAAYAGCEVE